MISFKPWHDGDDYEMKADGYEIRNADALL